MEESSMSEDWVKKYDTYYPRMEAYARARLDDPVWEPEDIAQEVFLRAMEAGFPDNPDSFSIWVYRIAHNLVVSEYRRRKWRGPSLEAIQDSRSEESRHLLDDSFIDSADPFVSRRLHEAIKELVPGQRSVIELKFFEDGGYTHEEIGQIVGKTPGAVKEAGRRGVAALRRNLGEI